MKEEAEEIGAPLTSTEEPRLQFEETPVWSRARLPEHMASPEETEESEAPPATSPE